jgi:hypothetical protein
MDQPFTNTSMYLINLPTFSHEYFILYNACRESLSNYVRNITLFKCVFLFRLDFIQGKHKIIISFI